MGVEQKRKNRKNTELEESKKNAVRVSGRWVWAFSSKEEQIEREREREREKEWLVGYDNAVACGAHNLTLFTVMPH